MHKKRILLLGGNYFPEPTGIGKYNGEMIEWLSSHGHDCAVITTYPYYPYWKAQDPYKKRSLWYSREKIISGESSVLVYRCPHYIPQNPSGARRMASDLSFLLSAIFPLLFLLFKKKYDYIITPVPCFQMGLLGIFYRLFKRAKFIYHIHDLQIEAAKELKMIESKFLFRMMFSIERYILKRADFISSVSEGMIAKIVAKCGRQVILFPNWVDTQTFYPLSKKEELKARFNFSPEEKIILYSGAIGHKQGLESILYVANELKRDDIKFVICGSGPYKERLMGLTRSMKLNNILFLPLQPKEQFNEFLNLADIHLVLQKANADDLVMPSKLTNIFSVGGVAVVTASMSSSLSKIIRRHNIAMVIEPEDVLALSASICLLIDEAATVFQKNARAFATEYLTIDKIIPRFLNDTGIAWKNSSSEYSGQKELVDVEQELEADVMS